MEILSAYINILERILFKKSERTCINMAKAIPIFRIFDYDKAIEFYTKWLGFNIDWQDREDPEDNSPVYM